MASNAFSSAVTGPAPLEQLAACPLCGSSVLRAYCHVPSCFRAGEIIAYDRCGTCDVVFRNPRLAARVRVEGYRERDYSATLHAPTAGSRAHYRFLVRLLRELQPAGAGRRILDFGCGGGGFLQEAKQAGLDPYGVEVNRKFARHVTATYGIPVHNGEISDAELNGRRFDLIVSLQVFEHLTDPPAVLAYLVRLLAPAGLLLIEVPNLHDVRERLRRGATMDDSHLFYFNRWSLGRLLGSCGLDVVEVHEGVRPSRLLGEATERLPLVAYRAIERTFSALQLKSVLAVIGKRA